MKHHTIYWCQRTPSTHFILRARILCVQLIKGLEAARGNGTSMISLIMPPKDQVGPSSCLTTAHWRKPGDPVLCLPAYPASCMGERGVSASACRHRRKLTASTCIR